MALSVNGLSPASVERDHRELEIRILLGAAYLALRGWAATAVLQTFQPARDLAKRLGDDEKLVSILWYLWLAHMARCEFPDGSSAVEGLYALARSRNDPVTSLVARWADCVHQGAQGHFQRARQVDEELLALYTDESHGHLLHLYNHDPISGPAPWRGACLWELGYPDQARQAVADGRERAQRVGHPFNRCWCLAVGTMPLLLRGEGDIAREWVAEAKCIAEEHGMAFVLDVLVPWWDSAALIVQREYESGYAKLAGAMNIWRAIEGRVLIPFSNMLMGQALMGLGRFDEAAGVLLEAVEFIERTGHRTHESEVRCALGELLRRQPAPNLEGAEASFRKALDVARAREARGSELRAAISLAHLWQSQGKRKEAHDLLAPIYGWFTEGFDTKDLKEAKALLDELN
jgi:predicted ATPase